MSSSVPANDGVHPSTSDSTLPTPSPPSSSNGTNNVSTAKLKLKRFRFIEAHDKGLLKAVRSAEKHIQECGKSEALYDEVLKLFLPEIMSAVFVHAQKPSGETLSDRFKRLVARRHEVVKIRSAASGIIEPNGENEALLGYLVLEIDEKEEVCRAEKEAQTEKEKFLLAAGDAIRSMALKRKGTSSDDCDEDDSAVSSTKKQRTRRLESAQSDDEITALPLRHGEEMREMENNRLEMERECIEIDRHKAEVEERRYEKVEHATNRRLDLDDKRFESEKRRGISRYRNERR